MTVIDVIESLESLETLESLDTLDSRMSAEAQPLVPEAYRAGYRRALRDVRDALGLAGAVAAPGAYRSRAAHGQLRRGR